MDRVLRTELEVIAIAHHARRPDIGASCEAVACATEFAPSRTLPKLQARAGARWEVVHWRRSFAAQDDA